MSVNIGKSEDVRTDTSFVEITVGDPEVADVNPLTDRALSILGKKNGTTRVSIYAEGKKLIGVFDVESDRLAASMKMTGSMPRFWPASTASACRSCSIEGRQPSPRWSSGPRRTR